MKYKTVTWLATCAAFMHVQHASAQSSVTIYGLLSAGVAYSPNASGQRMLEADSGQNQNPRWGLRGVEDLGGGTKAIFTFENGFNIYTGTAAQNGRLFGRQGFMGLTNTTWGTLTTGRQYDSVVDYLGPNTGAAWYASIGDSDNTWNDLRIQNSVKYSTPEVRGFKAEALYGFSNTGSFNDNSAFSFGAGYKNGPFSWNVAYAEYKNPNSADNTNGAISNDYAGTYLLFTHSDTAARAAATEQRIMGTGVLDSIGQLQLGAMITNVRYTYLDASHLTLNNFQVSANYNIRQDFVVGAGYVFTRGKYDDPNTTPMWHELNVVADYYLSKSTDISIMSYAQLAAGDAQHATVLGFGTASGKRQLVITTGIKHKF
jgi:general bacterial porin, GBP family